MGTSLALAILIAGISTLFVLDRDESARKQAAVWLPVIWLWINGSRSVSEWVGFGWSQSSSSELPGSSIVDQSIAALLTVLGIVVLWRRKKRVLAILNASWPIALFFTFALVSVLWSDFTGWGFKRWVRAIGELAMVLVVASDEDPHRMLRQILSRVGFILLPVSVILIKYFPAIGRAYDQWGLVTDVGVTTNKNTLGVITLVLLLGNVWQILRLLRTRKSPRQKKRLIAQVIIFLVGLDVLKMAHSATSLACFVIGTAIIFATNSPIMRRRPARIHAAFAITMVFSSLFYALGGEARVTKALGRNSDLTGRTLVWEVVLPAAPNAIVGAGFETFWLGPRAEAIRSVLGFVNEAHNGYIETYLNLGIVGVVLIGLILAHGYRRAVTMSRVDPEFGGLMIAYVIAAANYSIAEAGFRMLNPMWFFLLLSVSTASRLARMQPATVVQKIPSEPEPITIGPEAAEVRVPQLKFWNSYRLQGGEKNGIM